MLLKTRALFSLIPAALIASPLVTARASAQMSGYTIVMSASTTSGSIPATFKVAGDKMRLEADMSSVMGGRGGMGGMADGAYMLPRADGKLIIVLPKMQNPMGGGMGFAMALDMAGMAQRMGGQAPVVGDVAIEDLGAGETILGYKTRKFRMKQADGTTVDAWVADIPGVDFKKFATGFGAQFSGMNPRAAEKIPNGFALKVVVSGKDSGTMEVTKIDKTIFSDGDFEVPAGVQVMDMPGMGGRGRGSN